MENQKCISIVCLDLSTAFDTVNNKILLDVLKSYFGNMEQPLAWISSYLSNRKFLVQIGQLTSKIVEIDFSVPQGRNNIGKIKTWMEENHLKMNNARTEFIVLGTTNNLRKNTLDNIKIGNTKIHWTSKIKLLGVHLDEKLSLKSHIPKQIKKANYNLMLI